MNTTTDAHFVIGELHIRQNKPCQDHTRCGGDETTAYVAIADGCSTGGETDTGARIITAAAAIVLQEYLALDLVDQNESPSLIVGKIRDIALSVAQTLHLKMNDLQATLLYALITPQGGFVHVYGDGVVVLRYQDGTTILYQFVWKQNTPYYISYTGNMLENFIRNHSIDGEESFVVTRTVTLPDGTSTVTEECYSALEGSNGYSIPLSTIDAETLECIVVCSDGMETFKQDTVPIDLQTIMAEAIAFKQWQGEFVKRRLSRMLKNFSKEAIVHADDISIAAIHVLL